MEDVQNSVGPLHTRGVLRLNVVHLMVRQPQAPRTLHLAATDHLRYRVLEQYIRCHCVNFLEGTNNILNNRHTCALHVTYEIIIIVNFIIMELNSTNNVISNDIICYCQIVTIASILNIFSQSWHITLSGSQENVCWCTCVTQTPGLTDCHDGQPEQSE